MYKSFKTGQRLELSVALSLSKIVPKPTIIISPTIKFKDRTTSIDIVCIHYKTIFVLEMKNYNVSLAGDLEMRKWTARTSSSQYQIPNPIMQNKYHVSVLVPLLLSQPNSLLKGYSIRDYIVVKDSCELLMPSYLSGVFRTETTIIDTVRSVNESSYDAINNLNIRGVINGVS